LYLDLQSIRSFIPTLILFVQPTHCWGKLEILTLRKNNIEALHRDISVNTLCKTFQDAIVVTRALGFNYLWIDSLCIIQDDELDWERESASMAEVYGNAVVNIAATIARDGLDGLFIERSTTRTSRQYIRTNTSQMFEITDHKLYSRCLERTPLSRRSWAFQERFLARRTIHFSTEQIFCECRCHIACESHPTGLNGDPEFFSLFPKGDFPEKWPDIVSEYSKGLLTFPKDKLVALSGVARHLQRISGDEYCAGLWRKDLERQLCWRSDTWHPDQPPSESRKLPYRAPSWSWACTDRPIDPWLYACRQKTLVNVKEVSLVPLTSDPLGQLLDGHLKVDCGPLLSGASARTYHQPALLLQRGLIIYEDNPGQYYFMEVYFDSDPPSSAGDMFFLLIWRESEKEGGLVLARATKRCNGSFIRLGVWGLESFLPPKTNFNRLLERPGVAMDEPLYHEVRGADKNDMLRYSIIIV
jgi:hypothetical protein